MNLSGMGANNTIISSKGICANGGTVSANMTMHKYTYFIKYNSVTLNSAAVVTIEPGAVIRIEARRSINVNAGAKIIAEGTASEPITFTSTRPAPERGDWERIQITSSNGSDFKHCIFEYGSNTVSAVYHGMLSVNNSKISVMNCTFRHSKYTGILLHGTASITGFTAFDNNTIIDCGEEQTSAFPMYADGIMMLSVMGANNTITSEKGIGIWSAEVSADLTLRKYLYTIHRGTSTTEIRVRNTTGSATLTILPGAKLMFSQGGALCVREGGKLIAEGTSSDKIILTGTVQDKGWWNGVIFDNNSALSGSVISNCEISYGGRGTTNYNNGNITCSGITAGKLTIRNCDITYSRAWGIWINSATTVPTVENNNTFSNNGPSNNSNIGRYPADEYIR